MDYDTLTEQEKKLVDVMRNKILEKLEELKIKGDEKHMFNFTSREIELYNTALENVEIYIRHMEVI